uniref:Uncharacterized protein n=1 Tax=Anguilla anguilla TaxID=7936 RepID=A0A0E9R9U9_ANGAN
MGIFFANWDETSKNNIRSARYWEL